VTISCPKCAMEIDTTDADVALQATRCKRCRRLVDLSKHLAMPAIGGVREKSGSAPAAMVGASGGPRVPVPMPPKFRIEHGGSLKISWRWFGPQFLFLVFFCVFWDGFLIVWYSAALFAVGGGSNAAAAVPMLLFPLIHVAVGFALTYYTVCGFVNSTVVEAGNGRLTVKHGPLPWRGNLDIDASNLEQLYSEEIVSRTKNGVSRTYDVSGVERDGVSRKIVRGLTEPAQALFVEQALESQLAIADRAVGGELPR